jgi:hypothetical protein
MDSATAYIDHAKVVKRMNKCMGEPHLAWLLVNIVQTNRPAFPRPIPAELLEQEELQLPHWVRPRVRVRAMLVVVVVQDWIALRFAR